MLTRRRMLSLLGASATAAPFAVMSALTAHNGFARIDYGARLIDYNGKRVTWANHTHTFTQFAERGDIRALNHVWHRLQLV